MGAIGVSHTVCKEMSFDKIFDLTAAGVYLNFYKNTAPGHVLRAHRWAGLPIF